jgi:transcriptional regulator with XRE-family HTH domain
MLLRLKLKDLYAEKGLTQKKVSEETGIRASTLSGLANNLRTSWDVDILERLMVYFELDDIGQMIEFQPPHYVQEYIQAFNKQNEQDI